MTKLSPMTTAAEGTLVTKKILVVDIGGTNVKLMISRDGEAEIRFRHEASTEAAGRGDPGNRRAIGNTTPSRSAFLPPVRMARIMKDPKHLAEGWVGWDFKKSLGKPIRVINDAAMQALGSYHGGRMLFLGLGTGLGSALIWDKNVLPLELGDLPYGNGETIEDHLGKRGLEWLGRKAWQREVDEAVTRLKTAFVADYVVLGGGNAKLFMKLPEGFELGRNRNAYLGGCVSGRTTSGTGRAKWNMIS